MGERQRGKERQSFFYDLERYERDVRRADLSLFFSLRREKERERERERRDESSIGENEEEP